VRWPRTRTDAGREVLRIVEAHPELFTLGNHSYTHRDFRDLNTGTIRDELRRAEVAIRPYCSQELRPFFRPPNGGYDDDVLAAVGAAGYRYTVTWDIDTIDWRPVKNDPPGPTTDQIVAKVVGNARGGSIVLMHLGGYHTLEALPDIIDGLRGAATGSSPWTICSDGAIRRSSRPHLVVHGAVDTQCASARRPQATRPCPRPDRAAVRLT
jgi:peptidoglycan/xylan/chitin deacetylase (PgdA/CDA1 family)